MTTMPLQEFADFTDAQLFDLIEEEYQQIGPPSLLLIRDLTGLDLTVYDDDDACILQPVEQLIGQMDRATKIAFLENFRAARAGERPPHVLTFDLSGIDLSVLGGGPDTVELRTVH